MTIQKINISRFYSPCARLTLAAVIICLLATACSRTKPIRPPTPYESLLTILADYRRYSETDIYRHGIPKDISGQNIFRATIERLDYFEQSNPGKNYDVVAFTRGEACARLGDFARAIDNLSRIKAESPLYAKAQERIAVFTSLRKATNRSPNADQLGPYLDDLQSQRARLADLEKQFGSSFDAILARRELERVETEYALSLFRNRYVMEKGAPRALEFLKQMIKRHSSSNQLHSHQMMLGRFYLELSQDLATLTPPDRLGFDSALFHELMNSAQEQFALVSQADGYPEKLEGAAMLRELEALSRKINSQTDNPLPATVPKNQ